jgi:hypothetical protein
MSTCLRFVRTAGLEAAMAVAAMLLLPASLHAEDPARLRTLAASLRSTRTSSIAPRSVEVMAVKIRNRARLLGHEATAPEGTRYFAMLDVETLIGAKTQADMLALLEPPVVADGSVRKVEMLIDLSHTRPLRLLGQRGESLAVGTLVVDASAVRNLDVDAAILTNGLTVVAR